MNVADAAAAVSALGAKYGKRLALQHSKDGLLVFVLEIDEYGVEKSQYASGLDEDDALANAETVLALFGLPVESMRRDAFLDIARTLPTDVLEKVLAERKKP